MEQVSLYCTEICKKEKREFKFNVMACRYGMHADKDDLEKIID